MTEKLLVKGKLICVALNDAEQMARLSESFGQPPYNAPPKEPILYYKPRNTWNYDGAEIPWAVDRERNAVPAMSIGASLGAVIGKRTCRVEPERALEYLEGYTIVHDFSLPEISYFRPDITGKCLDGSAPVGPSIVPVDHLAELSSLQINTELNGSCKSVFHLKNLQRTVTELISKISYMMTLQPGDVIAIGFPGERLAIGQGDKVVSRIAGIGELSNRVGGVQR